MSMLYESVLSRLLRESKVDTFARSISQKLMRAAKKSMDKVNKQGHVILKTTLSWPAFMKRQDYFSTMQGKLDRAMSLGVTSGLPGTVPTIRVALLFGLTKNRNRDQVHMGGSWSPAHDVLTIEAIIDSTTGTMRTDHLSMIQAKAYEVIRHELEHTGQTDEKLFSGAAANQELSALRNIWQSPQAVRKYYTSEAETEAFVAGIYHRAKRERRPFIKVLDEMIEGIIDSGSKKGVSIVDLRNIFMEVRYRWIEYAKKRFPKAVVQ